MNTLLDGKLEGLSHFQRLALMGLCFTWIGGLLFLMGSETEIASSAAWASGCFGLMLPAVYGIYRLVMTYDPNAHRREWSQDQIAGHLERVVAEHLARVERDGKRGPRDT